MGKIEDEFVLLNLSLFLLSFYPLRITDMVILISKKREGVIFLKNLLIGIASLSLFLSGTSIVLAAPFNARNNPNIVANYPDGNHTVIQPDGSIAYNQQGADVVLLNGKSENAQQWFIGENGGIHTNFKDIGSSSSCPDSWTFLGQANPSWGTYFVPGDNYCASSNSLGH